MGDWKKTGTREPFQIKLPALNFDGKNGATISYKIPELKKSSPAKCSPNYLPKLPRILSRKGLPEGRGMCCTRKQFERKNDARFTLPVLMKNSSFQASSRVRNQGPTQPSWFRILSMTSVERQKRDTRNIHRKKYLNTGTNIGNLSWFATFDNHNGVDFTDSNQVEYTAADNFVPGEEDDEEALGCSNTTSESSQANKTNDSERQDIGIRISNVTLKPQPMRVGVVACDEGVASNPKREKCWIPNEQRRRLLGPKKIGVNEEKFLTCVSNYIRSKEKQNQK